MVLPAEANNSEDSHLWELMMQKCSSTGGGSEEAGGSKSARKANTSEQCDPHPIEVCNLLLESLLFVLW